MGSVSPDKIRLHSDAELQGNSSLFNKQVDGQSARMSDNQQQELPELRSESIEIRSTGLDDSQQMIIP